MVDENTILYKDPDANLDYGVNWDKNNWLNGDTLESSEWILPSGITGGDEFFDDTTTTIWLSGGTVGVCYKAVNRIITVGIGSNKRTDDRTVTLMIVEK